ncbi:MAG: inorganic diphosphatase, partial [Acidobacteria bacterium]|nr:inorganic diphosphatase [Acidobacteriota bacterium]
KGEETEEENKTVRNDRLIAVEQSDRLYSNVKDVRELPKDLIDQICEFFVNYNRILGKKFRVIGVEGADAARRMTQQQRVAA